MAGDRLPEGWTAATLGECVDVFDHLRVPVNSVERNTRRGSIPYYGATGQVGWIDDYLFDEELILLGEDGAPFLDKSKPISYIISGKSWVNNHAHVLRAKASLVTNAFIKYQLDLVDFSPYVTGSTRLKLTQAAMRRIPLRLPPLPEQRRIVAKVEDLLTRVNAAHDRLQMAPVILKRFRQAVLAAACSGRLTEDWRDDSLTTGLATESMPDVAELLEVQDIPPSWRWVAISDITDLTQYGTSVKADGNASTGVAILRMGNIQEGAIDLSDLKYIDSEAEDVATFSVRPGDILFNRTNSPELVGKAAVWDEELPAVFASYLIRIKCAPELASSRYVCSWINSPWGRSWARAVRTDGVSQSNINASKLRSMPVPLPSVAEQSEIVRRIEALFGLADAIERRIAAATLRAERLTQSILAKAFRGEVVPTEAELARREGRDYEPASALLERVSQEQVTADAEQRIQRSRPTKRVAQAIAEDRRRRR